MADNFDDFDQLRERSKRSSAVHDDMDDFGSSRGGGFASQFSPIQRLILAVLVLLDVFVVGFVLLSIMGVIG